MPPPLPASLSVEILEDSVRVELRRQMSSCGIDGVVFDTIWASSVAPIFAAIALPAPREATPVAWEIEGGAIDVRLPDDASVSGWLESIGCVKASGVTFRVLPLVRAPGAAS